MRRCWILVAAALLGAIVLLALWQRQRAPTAPPAVAFPATATDASQRIEQRLRDDHAFRNDVLFLLAATVRDRCQPAQAGLLARMANRASLPVLASVSAVTQQEPSLDRPIYQYIQHRADATQCGQPLQMPLAGGRSMAVDIEQYARTFPDSYFDPQRSSEPRDFGGLPLQQRAGNACNSVVYSVLPLGGTDWRCSSLRVNARARVRGLCEDELRRQHGGIGGELDAAVGQGMQSAVVSAIAVLPEDCR
ncbi:hypothetical protein EN794_006805 [Mesorhizobium sp. M00.F.Ca.ET.151.01.1.1]|nr:hypothetical protein EN842_07460 [bacterium M00.F.Ca.ET.199.01.1.1]TGT09163.1 hypothetical protein EN820_02645 [bacterium M00.F.Ca.ET.177.01.1.1]TGT67099.1 hypothetical protein EN813_002650 [Mesorhizobium sp. M00.F.Ca.ET.170.01.1.1]TGU16008.1 hypothetical protein EN806_02645 [bacterium M00.F.Ca.ET.163.01.1.1]TGU98738.1 hypothetical protein EN794_006805 [Mesorhizobium sp. M00.F.Ca.ET.151.01.1.1]TGV60403.1 hypothetical protein EN784_08195 [bacterium M00.F.Ca.ET.141.01.1.1]